MKAVFSVIAIAVALTSQVCLSSPKASAPNDCRPAEEAIADLTVAVADAYGAGDFDKAQPLLDKAAEQSKKGLQEARACGCDKVKEPLDKADALMKDALTIGGTFTEVQERLYAVIGQSESARRIAELCWRAKVATPNKK